MDEVTSRAGSSESQPDPEVPPDPEVQPGESMPSAGADPTVAAVFRAFFVGGRLQTVPVKRSKRLIVLDHIARAFEPGIRYPEAEVNAILLDFHPDFAMLRRYLVDEQFLSRDHGVYWRIGGTVDI